MDPRQRNSMGQFANAIASSPDAMRKAYGLAPSVRGAALLDLLRTKKGTMPKQVPVLPKNFERLDRVFRFAEKREDRRIGRNIAIGAGVLGTGALGVYAARHLRIPKPSLVARHAQTKAAPALPNREAVFSRRLDRVFEFARGDTILRAMRREGDLSGKAAVGARPGLGALVSTVRGNATSFKRHSANIPVVGAKDTVMRAQALANPKAVLRRARAELADGFWRNRRTR